MGWNPARWLKKKLFDPVAEGLGLKNPTMPPKSAEQLETERLLAREQQRADAFEASQQAIIAGRAAGYGGLAQRRRPGIGLLK